MATSSIFHNVILDTPEKVDAFIRACEASEADPYVKPAGAPTYKVTDDPSEIARIFELFEARQRERIKQMELRAKNILAMLDRVGEERVKAHFPAQSTLKSRTSFATGL